jgi:predicted  nucleic acid-binding Zn-ribbon protein
MYLQTTTEASECFACGHYFHTINCVHEIVHGLCSQCNAELLQISKEEKLLNNENDETEFEF